MDDVRYEEKVALLRHCWRDERPVRITVAFGARDVVVEGLVKYVATTSAYVEMDDDKLYPLPNVTKVEEV